MPTPADARAPIPGGSSDLELALTAAEMAGTQMASALMTATDQPAGLAVAEQPAGRDEASPADDRPGQRPSPTTPRTEGSGASGPTAGSPPRLRRPPSLRVGRPALIPSLKAHLPARQGAWIAWSALVGAWAAVIGLPATRPTLALAAGLGLGAWAAFPRRALRGALLLAATLGAASLVAGALSPGPAPIASGPALMAAGAVLGAGLGFVDAAPRDTWRWVHGALGGSAAAGLGMWVAHALVGPVTGASPVSGALHGAVLGLVASQSLVTSAITWVETDRIPSLGRIRATLAPPYRAPCLRAWRLDRGLARRAPDRETRDGLGEVAAWIYRLQWSLQALDHELAGLDTDGLVQRRISVLDRAAASEDLFTRRRLLATAEHLAAMQDHHATLVRERARSEAMREYASAFLEEARAGLALAHVQPGERVPEGLGLVLTRLRAHAANARAHRNTDHEVGPL